MEEIKCEKCEKVFSSEESLGHHNQAKHPENIKKPLLSPKAKKKIMICTIGITLLLILVYGIFTSATLKSMPPTDMSGHIEVNPPSHVLRQPMKMAIQKHMLEHADGVEEGRGGIIINYDCKNYECEPGLIEKLEAFTLESDYVYVAPYKNMKAKIVLTKLNRIITLDQYNEIAIENFIGS